MEFTYHLITRMPGKSYRSRFGSSLLYPLLRAMSVECYKFPLFCRFYMLRMSRHPADPFYDYAKCALAPWLWVMQCPIRSQGEKNRMVHRLSSITQRFAGIKKERKTCRQWDRYERIVISDSCYQLVHPQFPYGHRLIINPERLFAT